MLGTTVRLHDIDCVESFVASCLNRSGIRFRPDEREDLVAEGIAILYELADRYDGTGRFSGYAATFLPRRLGDAWHARNGHRRVRTKDGKRVWVYTPPPVSYDEITEGTEDQASREATILPESQWTPVKGAS